MLRLRDIFKAVMKRYPALVLRMAPLFLLLAFFKDVNLLFFHLNTTPTVLTVFQYLLMLILISCCYPVANAVLTNSKDSYIRVFKRLIKQIAIIIAFVFVLVLLAHVFVHIFTIAFAYFPHKKNMIVGVMAMSTLMIAFPLGLLAAKFNFFIPLMLCEKYSFIDAMLYSSQLTSGQLTRVLKLVGFAAVFCLISSQSTRHAQKLAVMHLNIPFDFLMLILFAPVIFGVSLLLMKDLMIRQDAAIQAS
jgi:hypothetical protein